MLVFPRSKQRVCELEHCWFSNIHFGDLFLISEIKPS